MATNEEVAVKLESLRARHPQLEYEARVYRALSGGGKFVVLAFGFHPVSFNT
jgi:hypothetical protein